MQTSPKAHVDSSMRGPVIDVLAAYHPAELLLSWAIMSARATRWLDRRLKAEAFPTRASRQLFTMLVTIAATEGVPGDDDDPLERSVRIRRVVRERAPELAEVAAVVVSVPEAARHAVSMAHVVEQLQRTHRLARGGAP